MSKTIEIQYHFKKHRPLGWHIFYKEIEDKLILELKNNGINPKQILYRGINYKDLKKLIKTGYDLPSNFNFYAGAISDGRYTIRTAQEYAYMKRSKPLFLKKSKNQFVIACYNKNYFNKNKFQEKSGYQNYNWILRSNYNYKQALQVIFVFKPVL